MSDETSMTITCINITETKTSGLRLPRDKEHYTTRCNRLELIERTLTSLICDYIYFNLGHKNDHIVLNSGHKNDHTVLFTLILDQEKVYIIFLWKPLLAVVPTSVINWPQCFIGISTTKKTTK